MTEANKLFWEKKRLKNELNKKSDFYCLDKDDYVLLLEDEIITLKKEIEKLKYPPKTKYKKMKFSTGDDWF